MSDNARDTEAVELLRLLVETPSPSGSELACCERFAAALTRLGFDSHIDEAGSVVGVRGCTRPDAPEIVLLGHIDTVPGLIPVEERDGLLYGRGTVDAKGPLAAFAIAGSRALIAEGVRLRIIGAVEEESATSAGARHAAARYRPAACIIGEPSGLDGVTIGYKGRLTADLRVRIPVSHSAGPACTGPEVAFAIWTRVLGLTRALRPDAGTAFEQIQVRLRAIASASDGLEEIVDASIAFRLPPGLGPEVCEAICREAGAPYQGVTWVFGAQEVAVLADRSNAVVRSLVGALRSSGRVPRVKVKTGTSDMNVVSPVWNCPIAAYGPGDSALDHTPNEHISLDEYAASIGVLTTALEILSGEIVGHPPPDGVTVSRSPAPIGAMAP